MKVIVDLEVARKLVQERFSKHSEFVDKADKAENYFRKENDILLDEFNLFKLDKTGWREADNRLPSNFFYILLQQKASYTGAIAITVDVGDDVMNQVIANTLGEKLPDVQQQVIINAGICWRTAIFPWIDEKGEFQYNNVDGRNFIPVYDDELRKNLLLVMYFYDHIDDDGKKYQIIEFYDDYFVYAFRREREGDTQFGDMFEYPSPSFTGYVNSVPDIPELPDNVRPHDFPGINPWCIILNNQAGTNDLNAIKHYIDCYDKTYSGFLDDLEDVQQVSFVISGYGGEDLREFKQNLKELKVIKLDVDEDAQGNVQMLTVQIPVEARQLMLEMTRKRIFEDGQGIDPDPENFGNSSGTALKHLYDNLELKAASFRAGAKEGFEKLVRLICLKHNYTPKYVHINWTANRQNDREEMASIVNNLSGIVSQHTLLSLLDFISDPDVEMEQIRKEQQETLDRSRIGLYPEGSLVIEDSNEQEEPGFNS